MKPAHTIILLIALSFIDYIFLIVLWFFIGFLFIKWLWAKMDNMNRTPRL